jgi:hypothetical protein
VDSVIKRFKSSKKASEEELSKLSKELRAYWTDISKSNEAAAKKSEPKRIAKKK